MHQDRDTSQLELFSQSENAGELKPRQVKVSFFTRIRGYEKVLLLVMAFVLCGILCFSLGVERGRRLSFAVISSTDRSASFTIQLAVFKNKEAALREISFLKKQGLTPQAYRKGNYIVLCVGKFSNSESAQPLLQQLQRTYAGCHIRRL
ncbi:MAG: SPOR domain-containing protein [Candidatus Omnitrophica bacterium]|jgi:hypothetical protein|nr:SPOR domain-containing protein [Candidatus Omnitrophota bacterium]